MIRWVTGGGRDGGEKSNGGAGRDWPDVFGAASGALGGVRGRLRRAPSPAPSARGAATPKRDMVPTEDLDRMAGELERFGYRDGARDGGQAGTSLARLAAAVMRDGGHRVIMGPRETGWPKGWPGGDRPKVGRTPKSDTIMAERNGGLTAILCAQNPRGVQVDGRTVGGFLDKCSAHGIHRAVIATNTSFRSECDATRAGGAVECEFWDSGRIAHELSARGLVGRPPDGD